MRIGIDATALPPQPFGAANYIVNLIQSLLRLDTTNDYMVFAKPLHVPLFEPRGRAQVISAPLATRILRIAWEQTALPWLAQHHRLDVLHSPHYTMPFAARGATVVTFHDMTFFLYPQLHKTYKRVFFRTMIHLASQRAHAIIADSESTRQDILSILHLDPRKVFAVPLGVSERFRPVDDVAAIQGVRKKFHLPNQLILAVGVLEPRKNLPTLVRAFKVLVERGLPHSLVLVGRTGWMYEELFRTIASLGLAERVIFTDYVPEEELPFVYNTADLFVYPSLYEGFGLPVLEAMACGVPVITSNISSMPEITGDAGILVEPSDVDALANAMERVLTDRALRDTLAFKGLARAQAFSWERTAQETLAVYQHVAQLR